jgi:hypothetical protein
MPRAKRILTGRDGYKARDTLAHHDGDPQMAKVECDLRPGRAHHGRSRMNHLRTVFVALILSGVFSAARAVPPTVTPSPGYDARLQEQRKALSGSSTSVQPAAPFTTVRSRHHGKRKH